MTSATAETRAVEQEGIVRDRAGDACRQAAHLSHEAQLLKSLATDAVEDGVHAAKQAIESIRRGVEELKDLKEEAVHRVKCQPLKAVGVALGVALVLGLAVGWIGWRLGHRE